MSRVVVTEHGRLLAADGALLAHPTVGRADHCTGYGSHRPEPARYVWHHILPEALGGATDALNLVPLCDTCHLCVHELLFMLKRSAGDEAVWLIGGTGAWRGSRAQRDYARRGWKLCLALGVEDQIPNEGGTWA